MKIPLRDMAGLSLGLEFAVSVILVAALGHWMDGRFHTDPTFTIVGFVMGTAAGFRSMYRFATRDERKPPRPPTPPAPPTNP